MSELTTNHDERDQMVSDQVDRSGCNSKEECPACHESSVDVNVHQSDENDEVYICVIEKICSNCGYANYS